MTNSDGRSTVYRIGDWCAVNNGQPFVDAAGCWWSVSREEGWSGAPTAQADVQKWSQRDGQVASNLRDDGREILLGGTVRAPTQLALQAAVDQVSAVLEGTVRANTLLVSEPHLTRHTTVRRKEGANTPVAKVSPFTATFLLQLVADDPRKFGDALSASTGLPKSTGGLTIPFTVPFSIDETVISGNCSITNPGKTDGPVFVRIDGPCTGPIITHRGSGKKLVLGTEINLQAGQFITIDAENELVLAQGQTSRNGSVIERGWPTFEPGVNTYSFTSQGSFEADARATVTAWPSWD